MSINITSLDKTIEQLLYRYECIILPGFGGFIVRDSPCNFNANKDQVKPFARHIFFNPHLQQNDGLLANEILRIENLSYQESNEKCKELIDELKTSIENNGSKSFGNLGTFFKGQENIWFAPNPSLNLSLESYGLNPVDVSKVQSEEKVLHKTIETPIELVHSSIEADNKPIESLDIPKQGLRPWLVAASVALIAHFIYLGVENSNINNNQASVIPSISAPIVENTPLVEAIDTTLLETPIENIDTVLTSTAIEPAVTQVETPSKSVDTAIIKEEIVPIIETIPSTNNDSRIARYMLEANAVFHQKDLLKKGIQARVESNGIWFEVIATITTEQ